MQQTDLSGIIATKFSALYNSTSLSDINIVIENEVINSHKIVLASLSPVFARIFENKDPNDHCRELNIPKFKAANFKVFLKFMYTGKVQLEEINQELLVIANDYQQDNLKGICENHLMTQVVAENVVELLIFALQCGCDDLKQTAVAFITDFFEMVESKGNISLFYKNRDAVQAVMRYTTSINKKEEDTESYLSRIDDEESEEEEEACFEFKFIGLTNLCNELQYGPEFMFENVTFKLGICKVERDAIEYLGVYFTVVEIKNSDYCHVTWGIRLNDIKNITSHRFYKPVEKGWGFPMFLEWNSLMDEAKGYMQLTEAQESVSIQVVIMNIAECAIVPNSTHEIKIH